MKWLSNSMNIAKTLSASAAMFTMVMAPVAQGAQAKAAAPVKVMIDYSKYNWNVDKNSVQEFMKITGLNNKKKMTVGEFYQKVRPFYPENIRQQMDIWVDTNRSEIMPDFNVSTYQDTEGKEQIRLQIGTPGQSATISYAPGSKDKYIKFNNAYLARTDMLFPEQAIRKLAAEDKGIKTSILQGTQVNRLNSKIKLGYQEYLRLTPHQRAEYMYRMRKLVESAEAVYKSYHGKQALNDFKRDYFVQWMIGEEANAAKKAAKSSDNSVVPVAGDPCLVSGYISVYGENLSCGGKYQGRTNLAQQMENFGGGRCSNGSVSCNPLLYGFSGGSAICVKNARADIIEATSKQCADKSPLRPGNNEDKKRIIESYMKSKGQDIDLNIDGDGKVSKEQYDKISGYLKELNDYVDKAVAICGMEPLSTIKEVRDDQMSACRAIALRKIDLNYHDFVAVVPAPPPPAPDCSVSKPGSVLHGNKCVCEAPSTEGTIKDGNEEVPACIPPEAAAVVAVEKDDKCTKDEVKNKDTGKCEAACGFFCKNKGLLIGLGVGGGLLALFWWMNKKKDTTPAAPNPCANPAMMALCLPPPPTTIPPVVQPPPPITTVTPTPPPPVVTPTPAPTVPPPIPTTTVETTTNPTTSTTGGVR